MKVTETLSRRNNAAGRTKTVYVCLAAFLCLAASCGTRQQKAILLGEHEIYKPVYAQGFSLYRYGDTTVLRVSNPWQFASDVEFNYLLTPNASPDALNEIKTPVTKVVCMSTTHVA
ncbi:MAG: hypothetical protein LBK97_07500, partial [Prevotellaceae bacterium]|nr:hypothetical protein [Prevotellaceae bacterium]